MKIFKKRKSASAAQNTWARPEMTLFFRAEIMPGRTREERAFRVEKVFPNGRVKLYNFAGEHLENEFEPIIFLREKS